MYSYSFGVNEKPVITNPALWDSIKQAALDDRIGMLIALFAVLSIFFSSNAQDRRDLTVFPTN